MCIQIGTVTEYPAIEEVLLKAYRPVFDRMAQQDAQSFASVINGAVHKYGKSGIWYINNSDGQVTGCVAYFAPGAVEHSLFTGSSAHVQLLGVSPSQCRDGVGKRLMQHCITQAKIAHAAQFSLQASELMPEARALYISMGFQLTSELKPAWGKPTYLYTLHLG